MNYLAHLFLSGTNEEVMVGNLMEDFIVGRIDHERNNHYSESVKKGIALHRIIDSFTDSSAIVNDCKSVLYEKYHKYSSVVVDIFFDHYLAIHWYKQTDENFEVFRKRVHRTFENNWTVLPEKMKPMIASMIQHDWLKNYSEFWGIERALMGISRRTSFESHMEKATEDLKIHYQLFDKKFNLFFPLLKQECDRFLIENKVY